MNEAWYAVKTRRNAEFMVDSSLRYKGYDSFLPTYRTRRRWSDRTRVLQLPLFGGYLFCRFDLSRRLPILTVPGVQFIVGIGKVPQAIDAGEIEAIRRVVESGVVYEPCPYVCIGQTVRICQGALTGLTGLVTQIKNKQRFVLSVNLLQRSVSVEIDRACIEPIKQKHTS